MQLSLEYGATIIDLQADGYKLKDGFYPATPTDLTQPVSERFDVLIIADNHWELEGKIRAIGLAITQARKHRTGPNGVYLNFAMIEDVDTWRARVTNGMLTWSTRLDNNWRRNRAVASVILERAPYWDGPEAQLPLSNLIESGNTDGLTVYNPSLHRYGSTISFAESSSPTPAKILDSGNGLADFKTGMTIKVLGSTSNDGTYTVESGGHAGYMDITEALVTEAAGDYVGIDAGICNYVDIAGADIEGELPAPVRLEITNTYNSASWAASVWIGQNVESDPENLVHILQAEDATGETPVADPSASGNASKSCTWNDTTEDVLLTWDLTTALLNQLQGNYQRILAHFTTTPGVNTWLRLKVYLDVTAIWTGPLVYLDSVQYIQELASLRLPPYLLGAGDLYPLTLELSAKHSSAGAHNVVIDYLQITPLDGWRKLVNQGYQLEYGARLVDDGIDDYLYGDGAAVDGKAGFYVGHGDRIQLQPGLPQRLYFLHNNAAGSAPIWRTLSIKAFYRPRKVTV